MYKLFDEVPYLSDGRIVLHQVRMEDVDSLDKLSKSISIYKYLPTYLLEQSEEDKSVVIKKMYDECITNKDSLFLGIYYGSQFVGLVELYGFKANMKSVCVGYRILEEYWGRGIATSGLRLIVNWLYSNTEIEIILAETMKANVASNKVLEHCGFTPTSVKVEDWGHELPTDAQIWFR